MTDPQLLFWPYFAPIIGRGEEIEDVARGKFVRAGNMTDAPIPWPTDLRAGKPTLIVTGDLVRAIKRESSEAIQHHWGVGGVTVYHWRKALGVGRITEGTLQRYRDIIADKLTPEAAQRGRDKIATDQVIRDRISASKRGKPAHPNTSAALLKAAKKKKSDEHKAKIAESNRKARRKK